MLEEVCMSVGTVMGEQVSEFEKEVCGVVEVLAAF